MLGLHHGQGQRSEGHKLTLRNEDDTGYGKNEYQGHGQQPVDGTIDDAVLPQQQGNLQIHDGDFR